MTRTIRSFIALLALVATTLVVAPSTAQASTECDSIRNQIYVAQQGTKEWWEIEHKALKGRNCALKKLAHQKAGEFNNRALSLQARYRATCL